MCCHAGDKELGKEGIKQLAKFKWTTLSAINLARNNLGKEGLKYLTRCEWNSLHQLDIGTAWQIQEETTSEKKAWST